MSLRVNISFTNTAFKLSYSIVYLIIYEISIFTIKLSHTMKKWKFKSNINEDIVNFIFNNYLSFLT